jgi:hypothetical protein
MTDRRLLLAMDLHGDGAHPAAGRLETGTRAAFAAPLAREIGLAPALHTTTIDVNYAGESFTVSGPLITPRPQQG